MDMTNIRRRAIRFPAKSDRIHALHTCHQAASWGPPKTVENHCISACPPKRGGMPITNHQSPIARNLVKMNDFTVLPCASRSSVPSGSWLPHWIPQGAPSKTVENPCVSEVPPLEFHWRSSWSMGCQHQYNINKLNSQKPLKTL